MGQVINFGGKSIKQFKNNTNEMDIIRLLPKMSNLKGETIVLYIGEEILQDEELLTNVLREIVILKCMQAIVIIIPDVNKQSISLCNEMFAITDPFLDANFVNIGEQADVFDVVFKREVLYKVSKILKQFNAMSIGLSGHMLDIVFANDAINVNDTSLFFERERQELYYSQSEQKKKKQYSVDMLEEILKTNIIPIVAPTAYNNNGQVYVFESSLFGAYISGYLSALKYTELYSNRGDILKNCIYGIEKFTKILKTGSFKEESLRFLNSGIEAIKNGVQGTHIIDVSNISMLEEFCSKMFSGLFLYDDTLNQL